jgi:plasmid stabilization system protein ParE
MTLRLIVAPEALAQAEAIDEWWRENRQASPDLIADELAAAFATIEGAPRSGAPVERPEPRGVRRVLLRATRMHVYYVLTDEAARVVAVWGAVRGAGPDLTGLV